MSKSKILIISLSLLGTFGILVIAMVIIGVMGISGMGRLCVL